MCCPGCAGLLRCGVRGACAGPCAPLQSPRPFARLRGAGPSGRHFPRCPSEGRVPHHPAHGAGVAAAGSGRRVLFWSSFLWCNLIQKTLSHPRCSRFFRFHHVFSFESCWWMVVFFVTKRSHSLGFTCLTSSRRGPVSPFSELQHGVTRDRHGTRPRASRGPVVLSSRGPVVLSSRCWAGGRALGLQTSSGGGALPSLWRKELWGAQPPARGRSVRGGAGTRTSGACGPLRTPRTGLT